MRRSDTQSSVADLCASRVAHHPQGQVPTRPAPHAVATGWTIAGVDRRRSRACVEAWPARMNSGHRVRSTKVS